MTGEIGYKKYFGIDLARLLAQKIQTVYPSFNSTNFINDTQESVTSLELVGRTVLIASLLKKYLPPHYTEALYILLKILGPENEKETGMFTTGYWLWPIAKFIEKYGIEHFDKSTQAIYEITKRHTGEYAIRPYINRYPEESLKLLRIWAADKNVHVRRLASEGIRPRLPWSEKITLFINKPAPVFEILEMLKDDPSNFVQKSVANNINDYFKVNPDAAYKLLHKWSKNPTSQRSWIIKHALRRELKKGSYQAKEIISKIS